jgi:hypothetical protein
MPELPNAEMILQLNASEGKYGVRWSEFGGRENRQRTKEKFFATSEARKRFCDKLEQSGNFHEFVAWSDPSAGEKESSAKTAKINKDVWKRLQDAFPGDGDLAFSPKYQEYIVKHGYFYSHGYDEDKLAAAVKKVIPEAQVTKATNHWNAWPKDSWFEVRFKVPEAPAPVAPVPAPAAIELEKPITSAKLASFHPLASFR